MVSVIFSGITMSLRLKRRSEFLGEILLFVSQVSMEIEFISLPLPEILKKIYDGECCRNLDFVAFCLENMRSGEDFFSSWKNGIEVSRLPMKKEEREKLKNLGSLLGTSDAKGQSALLSLYKSYFSAFYERAVSDEQRYGKMCVTLGIVLGTGVFILIL